MKKLLKQLLCAALSIVLMTGVLPMRAAAGRSFSRIDYVVTTMKQNTYVTRKDDTVSNNVLHMYVYKITVPSNGMIRIQGNKKGFGAKAYKKINKNKGLGEQTPFCKWEGGNEKIGYMPVRKGTYYLAVSSADGANPRFKWSFINSKNYDQQKNYCRSKAVALAKGKKKTVFFNFNYDFPRWYKITLTKKQRITLSITFMDDCAFDYDIIDSRGIDIDGEHNSFYYANYDWLNPPNAKTRVLPKGTYYLRIRRNEDDFGYNSGRICQIWWN